MLSHLNDKQKEAVLKTEGAVLVLAGAGSGKTNMMTHRIAYLIKEKNVSPQNILAVTFTNKAAEEMRKRIEKLGVSTQGLWIKTFHAAGLRILRENYEELGLSSNFTVLDEKDKKAVMKNILSALEEKGDRIVPEIKTVIDIISDAKSKNLDAYEFSKTDNYEPELLTDYSEVYELYEKQLKTINAVDFDDLIMLPVRLFLKNHEILKKYQNKFKYVMVDEYQDTNYIQFKLIHMIAKEHNNICVVGDDDQCIYEWRGANIKNILTFEKHFKDVKIVKLEQNYRSTKNILSISNSLIKNNKERKDKTLWTDNDQGMLPEVHEMENNSKEADFVVDKVKELIQENYTYNDIAILYRANYQSRKIEESFISKGLSSKYRVIKGQRFYDRKEIKDVLSYLKLIENRKDDASFMRVINQPKRGLGAKTLNILNQIAMLNGISLFECISNPQLLQGKVSDKIMNTLKGFANIITELRLKKDGLVSVLYEEMLDMTGYKTDLLKSNYDDTISRVENIEEFSNMIKEREKNDPDLNLTTFLEDVTLVSEFDEQKTDSDAVSMITLHTAKGLEYKVVFIIGVEQGKLPHERSEVDEERRLFYVGITRAKEKLFMSYVSKDEFHSFLTGKSGGMSEFLNEIDSKLYVKYNVQYDKRQTAFFDKFDGMDEVPVFDHDTHIPLKTPQSKTPFKSDVFVVGESVSHKKYGIGKIISSDEDYDEVEFADGETKVFSKGFLKKEI